MDYLSNLLENNELYSINANFPYTIMLSTNRFEKICEFLNVYKKCIRIVDFISFSWGLSSGENLLLNQFGKIIKLLKINKKKKYFLPADANSNIPAQSTVILLDEIEVSFHPEWQRIYLDFLLNFINSNIADSGTHIQLIIATHSPIILSDIPKQNSVFIKKNMASNCIEVIEGNETFAANIFSLYQNAFFLNEAGIGALAEKKLCELIEDIHKLYGTEDNHHFPSKSEKDKVIKRIKCIGDPYIRHKFEMEYNHTIETNEKTNYEKSELDREIDEANKKLEKLKAQRQKLGE